MKKPKNHIFRGPNSKNSPFPFLVWKKSKTHTHTNTQNLNLKKGRRGGGVKNGSHSYMSGSHWIRYSPFPLLAGPHCLMDSAYCLLNCFLHCLKFSFKILSCSEDVDDTFCRPCCDPLVVDFCVY